MVQLNSIKVEPETNNDRSCKSLLDRSLNEKIKYRNLLHHEYLIKEDPDADNKCSELINDTQVMCAITPQTSDGVTMHLKAKPAADVEYNEPGPLLVTPMMDAGTESHPSLVQVHLKGEVKEEQVVPGLGTLVGISGNGDTPTYRFKNTYSHTHLRETI